MRRLTYLLRETIANIRVNRTTTLIAIGTTGFTLACFGIFLLLYLNLRGVVGSLQEDIQVVLYLEDNLSAQGVAQLRGRLLDEPEVDSLTFVSKVEALKEFREQFPSEQHLLDGLGTNPLPASLIVNMASQFRSPEAVQRWTERQRSLPGVGQVQYSRAWIENLERLMGFLELGALAIGALLSLAAITIIANTIRLTLYARRDEIEIMRLIGATGMFIKIPYFLEGAVLGAVGGALSVLLLRGCYEFVTQQLGAHGRLLGLEASLAFFPAGVSALMVVAGFVLGSSGSLVSFLGMGRMKP